MGRPRGWRLGQISLSTWPAALAFAKFRRGGASEIAKYPVLRLPGAGAPEFAKSRDPGSAPGDLASALRRRPCSWGRSLRGVVGCLRAASDCQPPPPPPPPLLNHIECADFRLGFSGHVRPCSLPRFPLSRRRARRIPPVATWLPCGTHFMLDRWCACCAVAYSFRSAPRLVAPG